MIVILSGVRAGTLETMVLVRCECGDVIWLEPERWQDELHHHCDHRGVATLQPTLAEADALAQPQRAA